MVELIEPSTKLRAAWLEAHNEWGPGAHEDGFGLRPSDDVRSAVGFRTWVHRLSAESGRADTFESGQPAGCRYRWIIKDSRVLGGIALRYGDTEQIRRAGHIGYGIRPSARRQGLATWALEQILDEARHLGMERVLVVCATNNVASAKTIERQGGVLEGIEQTEHGPACRYWIKL
jgi:predicted acetyltransferase